MATNIDVLTRSHAVLKLKQRAKKNQIESVVFDEQSRFDFLTGFQKRNIQKKEAARAKAKAREREERLQLRKEQRKALKDRAQENARQVESVFQDDNSDREGDASDGDFETGSSTGRNGEGRAVHAYEDEEQLATVTVVEDCDPDSFRHPQSEKSKISASVDVQRGIPLSRAHSQTERPQQKKRTRKEAKPKRNAYETKAARKVARSKQRSRKLEKAELAGGKSSKKSRSENGRRSRRAK